MAHEIWSIKNMLIIPPLITLIEKYYHSSLILCQGLKVLNITIRLAQVESAKQVDYLLNLEGLQSISQELITSPTCTLSLSRPVFVSASLPCTSANLLCSERTKRE